MTDKPMTALRVTPESLRLALKAVPELGEMHVNEVLGAFLVLNVPRKNKDGSISKRPAKKFILIGLNAFSEDFMFVVNSPRTFAQVAFR